MGHQTVMPQDEFLWVKIQTWKDVQQLVMWTRHLASTNKTHPVLWSWTVELLKTKTKTKLQIKFIPTSNLTTFSTNNICEGWLMFCMRLRILMKENAQASAECLWRPIWRLIYESILQKSRQCYNKSSGQGNLAVEEKETMHVHVCLVFI